MTVAATAMTRIREGEKETMLIAHSNRYRPLKAAQQRMGGYVNACDFIASNFFGELQQ